MNNPIPAATSSSATVVRLVAGLIVAVLTLANLGLVHVNLVVVTIPIPLAPLIALTSALSVLGALRWNAMRVEIERERLRRRRELDELLGYRRSDAVSR